MEQIITEHITALSACLNSYAEKGPALPGKLRIADKIKGLSHNLACDIKKLTNFTLKYRFRVGNWRVLFEVEGERIVIYRILHRNKSYTKLTKFFFTSWPW